jgi:integration host factor subunit alpha
MTIRDIMEAPAVSVTRDKLAESVRHRTGFQKGRSRDLVDITLEMIESSLSVGEDVLISGFGKFCVNRKGPRKGRNPHTGGDLTLDERRVVTFKPSGVLRGRLNGQG